MPSNKSILYRALDGYKYELHQDYRLAVSLPQEKPIQTDYLDLDGEGNLTIRAGYAWDGPSGPAIDTRNFMRGSLVHDALYQLIRMGRLPIEARPHADAELRRLCREDGMSWIRAAWVFAGVRAFAQGACRPNPQDLSPLFEAP